MKNETKKRYQEVKNFFKSMEQNCTDTNSNFTRRTPRRSSDSFAAPAKEGPKIKYMSFRVKKPPSRLPVMDVFEARTEETKVIISFKNYSSLIS
jgi:hypothetical protein